MNDRIVRDTAMFFDHIFRTLENVVEFPWQDFNVEIGYNCPNFPPVDVIIKNNKDIIFKFALAGYEEGCIDLHFEGDYMILTLNPKEELNEDEHYVKRGIKKSRTMTKYHVPGSLFNQEKAEAMFRRGLLIVKIPSDEKIKSRKINIEVDDD
jgi:HSP20 family molecular chaperone IbpA